MASASRENKNKECRRFISNFAQIFELLWKLQGSRNTEN